MTGSNRRPSACKADALPAELILHYVGISRSDKDYYIQVFIICKGYIKKILFQFSLRISFNK